MIFDIRDCIKSPCVDNPVDPVLKDIFDAFNRARLRYCLLRGYNELSREERDLEVDLLVDPCQLGLLRVILRRFGYLEKPSWGHAPHKFFVSLDADRGSWIKFDVVTQLRYGDPIRRYRLDLVENCLEDREIRGNVFTLSIVFEFITLLLHSLLDKRSFPEKHAVRLTELWMIAEEDERTKTHIQSIIDQYLSPSFDINELMETIDQGDWEALDRFRIELVEILHSHNPVLSSVSHFLGLFLRKLRPLLMPFSYRGISVALIAPDGAGKSTLAQSLLDDKNLRARLVYMGSNVESSTIGLPTTQWLKNQVKQLNGNRSSTKGVVLRATNYLNRLIEQWFRILTAQYHKALGRCVVFDRYTYDSYLAVEAKTIGKKLRRWMLRSICPTPDLTMMLDAPGKVLYERKGEHSPEVLEHQRRVFLRLADKIPNMRIVDATQNAECVLRNTLEEIWRLRIKQLFTR